MAAIDANEDGSHVHITESQHSESCFPDGFKAAMSNGFQVRVTIRKRTSDDKGRVTCKGSKKIVAYAGLYLEKVCENLS
mgnify:CR=1 FL=1